MGVRGIQQPIELVATNVEQHGSEGRHTDETRRRSFAPCVHERSTQAESESGIARLRSASSGLRDAVCARDQAPRGEAGLRTHRATCLTVNAMLVSIWYATFDGFFWPLIVMLLWSLGVVRQAWDVYFSEPTPDRIAAEMERLRRRSA